VFTQQTFFIKTLFYFSFFFLQHNTFLVQRLNPPLGCCLYKLFLSKLFFTFFFILQHCKLFFHNVSTFYLGVVFTNFFFQISFYFSFLFCNIVNFFFTTYQRSTWVLSLQTFFLFHFTFLLSIFILQHCKLFFYNLLTLHLGVLLANFFLQITFYFYFYTFTNASYPPLLHIHTYPLQLSYLYTQQNSGQEQCIRIK